MKKLEVKAIISNNKENQNENYTLYLLERDENVILPLEIDPVSAQIITLCHQGFPSKRPQIHDAMNKILELLNAEILQTSINSFADEVFHASVRILHAGMEQEVDVRLSDAVAIAVKLCKPIFIKDELLETFGIKLTSELVGATNIASEEI